VSSSSPVLLSRRIAHLDQQRRMLLSSRTRLRDANRELREAEWVKHPEVAPGYSGTLAMITRQVMAAEDRHGWFPPFPSAPPADIPLGTADMLDLRALLASGTLARQARRHQRLPDIRQFPSVEVFTELVAAAQRYEQMAGDASEFGRALGALGDAELVRQPHFTS